MPKKKLTADMTEKQMLDHIEKRFAHVRRIVDQVVPMRYRAMRSPKGPMMYVVDGVSYSSMKDLRKAASGRVLERIKATKKNRIFE